MVELWDPWSIFEGIERWKVSPRRPEITSTSSPRSLFTGSLYVPPPSSASSSSISPLLSLVCPFGSRFVQFTLRFKLARVCPKSSDFDVLWSSSWAYNAFLPTEFFVRFHHHDLFCSVASLRSCLFICGCSESTGFGLIIPLKGPELVLPISVSWFSLVWIQPWIYILSFLCCVFVILTRLLVSF